MHVFNLVACLALQASFTSASPLVKRAVDYYNTLVGGGSMLDSVGEHDQSITKIFRL
jgi:hypothetical protein